ncbi:FAD-dependent oxidoreductase [Consotaella aegiceratis]|uniref:FAD-dependent oxidoreductase n=1 Tax=Consotaella aegiceratis TaxID=3097961 RepID=UPI002F3FBFE8
MNNDERKDAEELDEYTRSALRQGLSRRSFLRATGAGAAGLGALGMGGVAAAETVATDVCGDAYGTSSDGAATLSFLKKPEPIADEDIAVTETYDVVVIGAGASGVPAALSAAENGAKVAVLQKAPRPVSQGNTGSGINLDKSDKAAMETLVARLCADNNHRSNPAIVREYVYNSGEAVNWVIDRVTKNGTQVISQGNGPHGDLLNSTGLQLDWVTSFFGPKPYNTGDGMRGLAEVAEQAGVKFFYKTPAVHLVQDESGAVLGVIGQGHDGKYVKLLANKGVIMATGDYQNNEAMSDYFIPDIKNMGRKQFDKTGDGHAMIYWAGGVFEPIGHTKMLHDFDAGPALMCDMPFLVVNMDGERFINETVPMSLMNNYLRSAKDAGHYCQIFDADYTTQAADWPGRVYSPEELKTWMPDDPSPKEGVIEPQINTHVADTLEELAAKLEVDPDKFVATVKRYNELVASGKDPDFGKPAKFLVPVEKAPFYGIHRHVRVSAICSGMLIDDKHRVLDADGGPIKGLWAIGNCSGGFYGGVDYPLTVYGMSLGRCYTNGYVVGKQVATL